MRGKAIPGHAKNYGVVASDFRMKIAKVLPFGRAARRAVPGVKVENDIFALQRLQVNHLIAGCRAPEVRYYTVERGNGHILPMMART